MEKIFRIGWKDVLTLFSNPTSLLLMLLAPFVLTMALGAVTGSIGPDGDGPGISAIPIAFLNQDDGPLGDALEQAFHSDELADLITVTAVSSETESRELVEDNQVAVAVLIPADFSASIIPGPDNTQLDETVSIEIYANPTRPIGAGIVNSIVNNFVGRLQSDVISVELIITQLAEENLITPEQIPLLASELSQQYMITDSGDPLPQLVTLQKQTVSGEPDDNIITPLSTLAPGMAIFFLIYTVITGGRGILTEWEAGTMPRLLTTPTTISQVLAGKTLGIFLSGFFQVGLLIIVSALLFGLRWGNPLAILILISTVVVAATGWGLVLAGSVQTSAQVATIGSAMMLIFGILGGSLAQIPFTGVMLWISYLTPNAWATEGFSLLAAGGTITDILPIAAALLLMATLLFIISVILFRKRWA